MALYARNVFGRLILGVVLLGVLGTLGIFLFPCAFGPYPVTHGPATTLCSKVASPVLDFKTSTIGGLHEPIRTEFEVSRMPTTATSLRLSGQSCIHENTLILRC